MKRVLDDIIVKTYGDDEYILLDDFRYHVGSADSEEVITVRAGLITDFGSVPRWARSIVEPMGVGKPAFLVHDQLYQWIGMTPEGKTYSRKECDKIMREILGVVNMPWHEKFLAYHAVRFGGQGPWNDHVKEMKL